MRAASARPTSLSSAPQRRSPRRRRLRSIVTLVNPAGGIGTEGGNSWPGRWRGRAWQRAAPAMPARTCCGCNGGLFTVGELEGVQRRAPRCRAMRRSPTGSCAPGRRAGPAPGQRHGAQRILNLPVSSSSSWTIQPADPASKSWAGGTVTGSKYCLGVSRQRG